MIFLLDFLVVTLSTLLLFCADIWWFFLCESNIFHFLMSFLIVQIVYFRSLYATVLSLFFLAIESWIIYGTLGGALIYALPISALLFAYHSYIYLSLLYPAGVSLLSSLASLITQATLWGIPISGPYAVGTIFANIGVVLLFSLKITRGKTRQSLRQHTV